MKLHQLTCTILSMALLVGCGNTEQAKTPVAEKSAPSQAATEPTQKPAESYVVSSQTAYPPFVSLDEKGNLIGLDIDILTAIGEKQKINFSFVPNSQTISELLTSVNQDKAESDIVISGINITEERLQQNDFSTPYLYSNWVALADKSGGKQFGSFEELAGQSIAVQEGTASESKLAEIKITDKPVLVKSVYLGVNDLKQNKVVAVYDVDSVLSRYLSDSNLYMIQDKKSGQIPLAFALKKGNVDLKAKLDKGLEQIKQDGTYDKIVAKWLNHSETHSQQASETASTPK